MNEKKPHKKYIKQFLEHAEHNIEMPASAGEVLATSMESTEGMEESPFIHMLHTLPLIGDFIRGIHFSLQAVFAITDKDTPQRKTKIAAGLFGGIISLGAGIVGSLFLASIGLLATGSALVFAPIVLAAAVTGVYAVALYRDSYILHQLQKELAELNIIEKRFPTSSDLFTIEDVYIAKNLLDKKIKKMEWSVATNLLFVIAFSFLLAAVFATGVGAIALAATAGTMIVVSTAKRMHDSNQDYTRAIALVGITLLVGAAFATGIGAVLISIVGITLLSCVFLKKVLDNKNTVKSASAQDNSTTEFYHQDAHSHPELQLKKEVKKTERREINPDHTHLVTGSHASIFDHHAIATKKKSKVKDEKDTDSESDSPHDSLHK